MGMYTELNVGVAFKKDTPNNVINIIKYMLNEDEFVYYELPDHPLFKTARWNFMLVSDSYYFDGQTDSSLHYDDISSQYYLNVRCNLKNYDGEIEKFMEFIQPYLDTRGFLGYTRYEEFDDPTLIYNSRDGIVYEKHGDRDCTAYW